MIVWLCLWPYTFFSLQMITLVTEYSNAWIYLNICLPLLWDLFCKKELILRKEVKFGEGYRRLTVLSYQEQPKYSTVINGSRVKKTRFKNLQLVYVFVVFFKDVWKVEISSSEPGTIKIFFNRFFKYYFLLKLIQETEHLQFTFKIVLAEKTRGIAMWHKIFDMWHTGGGEQCLKMTHDI